MPTKKKSKGASQTKSAGPKKPSKTDFVRGLADLTAAEVIAKAKEAGMTLSSAHVYAIRSKHRLSKKKKGGAKAGRKAVVANAPRLIAAGGSSGNLESVLRSVAEAIGTAKSIEILAKSLLHKR